MLAVECFGVGRRLKPREAKSREKTPGTQCFAWVTTKTRPKAETPHETLFQPGYKTNVSN